MKLPLTVALFILVHVCVCHAAPLTSSSPLRSVERRSLSVASNKIPPTEQPGTVHPDGTTFLVDATMPTPSPATSNITTPNDSTTISSTGIAARDRPRWIITMTGEDPLSCSIEQQVYINDAISSMEIHLASARDLLSVPGAEGSVGARMFFGKITAQDRNNIRDTPYGRPKDFIESAKRKDVKRYRDIKKFDPPGEAILFGCPEALDKSWSGESNACFNGNGPIAFTMSMVVTIGQTRVNQIMLCPMFFQGGIRNPDNSPSQRIGLKNTFKYIVEGGQDPLYDYFWEEGGHMLLHEFTHASVVMGPWTVNDLIPREASLRNVFSIQPPSRRAGDAGILGVAGLAMTLAPEIFHPDRVTTDWAYEQLPHPARALKSSQN